jgi:signal peptidase I
MKRQLLKTLFGIGFILIILFFIWSKLILASLVLIIILDSFTLTFISKLIKNSCSQTFFKIIKYGYIILLPILFAVFLRTFFFDVYFVPSSSMERTLLPNDYVLVNKISYGVKVPKHFRNIPVIGNFFKTQENEFDLYRPLKAFKKFKREDIVVFKAVDGTDKLLIKRIIGMPSDTLQIMQTEVFVNSMKLIEKHTYTYQYVKKSVEGKSLFKDFSNTEYNKLSIEMRQTYSKWIKNVTLSNYYMFPVNKQNVWMDDNYGPIIIPKKGMTILLNVDNIDSYKDIILKFEGKCISLKKGETKSYTFKINYFFMLGDNRHNSLDSRVFGFVPESYIQGKMIKVFSKKRLLEN